MIQFNKYYKYEIIGVSLGLLLLAGVTVPRFLRVQTSAQVKTIQHHLDQMVERMIENPAFFTELTLQSETEHYADHYPYIEIKGTELGQWFSDIQLSDNEKKLTFYLEGGPVTGGMKDEIKKRTWNWEEQFITLYVYLNKEWCVRFVEDKERNYIMFPPPGSLYNPSNGLGSVGVLYAHSYEMLSAKKIH